MRPSQVPQQVLSSTTQRHRTGLTVRMQLGLQPNRAPRVQAHPSHASPHQPRPTHARPASQEYATLLCSQKRENSQQLSTPDQPCAGRPTRKLYIRVTAWPLAVAPHPRKTTRMYHPLRTPNINHRRSHSQCAHGHSCATPDMGAAHMPRSCISVRGATIDAEHSWPKSGQP